MRRLLIVDTESSGLDVGVHIPLEVAWMDYTTGDHGVFIPPHDDVDLSFAEPKALQINRYWSRIAGRPQDVGNVELAMLYDRLKGNTLGGCNPSFDAAMLSTGFTRAHVWPVNPWHHRLADISTYTAGVLGIDPTELPGLAQCCEALGVAHREQHSALGDVLATAECFRELKWRTHPPKWVITCAEPGCTQARTTREAPVGVYRCTAHREGVA